MTLHRVTMSGPSRNATEVLQRGCPPRIVLCIELMTSANVKCATAMHRTAHFSTQAKHRLPSQLSQSQKTRVPRITRYNLLAFACMDWIYFTTNKLLVRLFVKRPVKTSFFRLLALRMRSNRFTYKALSCENLALYFIGSNGRQRSRCWMACS